MKWKHPPLIKIYEALGAIADGRIVINENSAAVQSSSGNKIYTVSFNPEKMAIMANDNGSYWQGYLGYPSIAFLMKKGYLDYNQNLSILLKDIPWKDINQKYRNDFDKALSHILESLEARDREKIIQLTAAIDKQIKEYHFLVLGNKQKPPEGY